MSLTERLARASALHPWRTIVAWVAAILIAVAAVVFLLADALTTEGYVTNEPESLRAYDVLSEEFPAPRGFDEIVVVGAERLGVDDPAFREQVGEDRITLFRRHAQ